MVSSVGGTDASAVTLYSDADCTTPVGADATEILTVYAKGVSAGTATVTVTSNADATKTASCDVTVNAPAVMYQITWLNDDGSVIDRTQVASGTTPTHADATKAATAQYTYTFAGWTPELAPATGDATYTATYTATPIPAFGPATFTLPASTTRVGESAFEGLPMTVVEIPDGCERIYKWAFKDCTSLAQIRIPASVTDIDETAFDGCEDVLVYGAASSAAETFCSTHANCHFIPENTGE